MIAHLGTTVHSVEKGLAKVAAEFVWGDGDDLGVLMRSCEDVHERHLQLSLIDS